MDTGHEVNIKGEMHFFQTSCGIVDDAHCCKSQKKYISHNLKIIISLYEEFSE